MQPTKCLSFLLALLFIVVSTQGEGGEDLTPKQATNLFLIKAILRHFRFRRVQLAACPLPRSDLAEIFAEFNLTLASFKYYDAPPQNNSEVPSIVCVRGLSGLLVAEEEEDRRKSLGAWQPLILIGPDQTARYFFMNKINPLLNQRIYFVQEDTLCLHEAYSISEGSCGFNF